MSVYVDDALIPFQAFPGARTMLMSHMWADSREELDAMAGRIGVQRKWIQYPDDPARMHYDISKGKRELALKHGAIAARWRDWGNWRGGP